MIKTLLRSLIILLILIMAFIAFLLTPMGLRFGMDIAGHLLPGKLTYQEVSGIIIGPMTIDHFKYVDNNQTYKINKLKLNWRPINLFKRELHISRLKVDGLTVITKKNIKPQPPLLTTIEQTVKFFQPMTEPKLPITLKINHAVFDKIHIKTPDRETQIDKLLFNSAFEPTHFTVDMLAKFRQPQNILLRLKIHGKPNNYNVKMTMQGKHTDWLLTGKGSQQKLALATQKTRLLDGNLQLNATIFSEPFIKWQGKFQGTNIDLQRLNPQWPNQLSLNIDSSGNFAKQYQTKTHVNIKIHTGTINLTIAHQKNWHMSWDIQLHSLGQITENVAGAIKTKGTLNGNLSDPKTTGTFRAQSLQTATFKAHNINAQWAIDFSNKTPSHLLLTAQQLQTNDTLINHTKINIKGFRQKHVINANITFPQQNIVLTAKGGYGQGKWKGALSQLSMEINKHQWTLKKSANVTLNKNAIGMTPLCLSSKTSGSLCINGNISNLSTWHLQIKATRLPNAWLSQFLSNDIHLAGNMSAHIDLKGEEKQLEKSSVAIHFYPGSFQYISAGQTYHQKFTSGDMNANFEESKLTSNIHFQFNPKDFLQANITLPNYSGRGLPDDKTPIMGSLKMRLDQFDLLNAWVPRIHIPSGQLLADLQVSGQLIKPRVNGKLSLKGVKIFLPQPNITLSGMTMTIAGEGNLLHFDATAFSGKDPITVKGTVDLADPELTTEVTLTTNKALLLNTDEYMAIFTSNLKARVKGKQIWITGNIDIPTSKIKPHDFRETVSLPENDITYIGKQTKEHPQRWYIHSDITVNLGNDVRITAAGVKARLKGSVRMIGEPNQDTTATGQISIKEGTYSVYGSTLVISPDSYISYTHGPLNNPILSLSASKKIATIGTSGGIPIPENELTVGVQIHGTVKAPKITFFSRPPGLTQASILSYILLGYGTTKTTAGNTDFLLRAISAVDITSQGLMGKENIATQIRQGLGLSEMGVESETTVDALGNPLSHQSSFVLGKHLTQSLYVRYSIGLGLTDPVNVFQVGYLLGKHWVVQTDSSSKGNGADVLYTIEKN